MRFDLRSRRALTARGCLWRPAFQTRKPRGASKRQRRDMIPGFTVTGHDAASTAYARPALTDVLFPVAFPRLHLEQRTA
jgi:hypothetical protein